MERASRSKTALAWKSGRAPATSGSVTIYDSIFPAVKWVCASSCRCPPYRLPVSIKWAAVSERSLQMAKWHISYPLFCFFLDFFPMVSSRLDLKCQLNCPINVDHTSYKVVILEVAVGLQRWVHCAFIKAQSDTSDSCICCHWLGVMQTGLLFLFPFG